MKSHNFLYFLLSITALTVGCKVSKDISRPLDAIPEGYRGATPADTTSIAALPVKDFFGQPELQQLIDTALVRNYDLQLAIKNIDASDLLFRQSRMGNLPILDLQIGISSNRPSSNSLNGLSTSEFLKTSHIEDYQATLGLSWEADLWGKIKSQKQAALASYLQTAEVKKAIQTRLIASVAEGYYQLLMMDAQLKIAQQNLRLNDSTLKIIHMQFDAGQVSSLAIQQAEALQLAAAQLVPKLEQNITVQENALKILTGDLPAPIVRLSTLENTQILESPSVGLPSSMVSRRPDVKAAEFMLDVANARVGITKANFYPSLRITASGGLNSLQASNWLNVPASLFGMVGGGLTQPVFQRKQLKTQYELAKIDRDKAVIQFRQSVLLAVGEVSDELVKLEKLKVQHEIGLKRVMVLQQAVSNANMLFISGMANYLEVLTAQSNLLQSELELAVVKTARLAASVELYRALGGGQ